MDSAILNALADPHRLQIIELLRYGPLTVGEIAIRVRLRQPQASKHLKILYDAGFAEVMSEGNRRYYRIRPAPLRTMVAWLESFPGMWEERFDRLGNYLEQIIDVGETPDKEN